jgi:hypothetical protein
VKHKGQRRSNVHITISITLASDCICNRNASNRMLWSSISSTLKFSLLSSHPRLGHAQIMTSRTRDAFHWVWSPRACQGQYRATYTCTRVHGKRERRLFRWGNSTVCPEKPPLEPTKRVSGQTVRSAQRIIRSTKSWSLFSLLYNIYAYIHVCIYIYIYI